MIEPPTSMLASMLHVTQQTAVQIIEQARRQAAIERAMREKRAAIAERSWMNRAQRRAAARGESL